MMPQLVKHTSMFLKRDPDIKLPNNPTKNWGTDLNREFSTEELQMIERHLVNCSTSLDIRKMQMTITLRYHPTPLRMGKIKNTKDSLG